jgi:hypothetical protein
MKTSKLILVVVLAMTAALAVGTNAATQRARKKTQGKAAEGGESLKELRIAPKRGSATVKGSIAWGHSDSHKLAARAGQKLTLKLSSSNTQVFFALFAPDGKIFLDAVASRAWSGELPQKGDYTITVVNNEKDSPASAYTLEVTLK